MGFRAALCLAFFAATVVDAEELPRCDDAWTKVIHHNLHKYNFEKFGSSSSGYRSYWRELNAESKVPSRRDCKKDWTVLIAMDADNDLFPYALWDLYELESAYKQFSAGSVVKTDVLVQLNSRGPGGLRRLHMFQSPRADDRSLTRKFFATQNESFILSPVVAELPEVELLKTAHDVCKRLPGSLKGKQFCDFLMWGLSEYPAEHVMVILWGHGLGFRMDSSQGFLPDREGLLPLFGKASDVSAIHLDTPSLRNSLRAVVREGRSGKPLDVYASDMCLMQMAEVATEISSSARFIVGSAQVQSYLGLPYRRLLTSLNMGDFSDVKRKGDATDEALWLSRKIPKLMLESMSQGGLQGRYAENSLRTLTMNSINTAVLEQSFLPGIEEWSQALLAYLKADPMESMTIAGEIGQLVQFEGQAVDLGATFGALQTLLYDQSELSEEGKNLRRITTEMIPILNRTIEATALGTDYINGEHYVRGYRGFSAWIPLSASDFDSRVSDFQQSDFWKKVPSWSAWIKKLVHPF